MRKLIYVQHTRLLLDVAKRFPLIQSARNVLTNQSHCFFKMFTAWWSYRVPAIQLLKILSLCCESSLVGYFFYGAFYWLYQWKGIHYNTNQSQGVFLRCLQLDGLTEHELSSFWKFSVCAANLSEIFLLVCFLLTLLMNRNTLLHWIF